MQNDRLALRFLEDLRERDHQLRSRRIGKQRPKRKSGARFCGHRGLQRHIVGERNRHKAVEREECEIRLKKSLGLAEKVGICRVIVPGDRLILKHHRLRVILAVNEHSPGAAGRRVGNQGVKRLCKLGGHVDSSVGVMDLWV